jgi:hypothetical protein
MKRIGKSILFIPALIFIGWLIIFSGCTVTFKTIEGNYTNSFGDTLLILADGVYEYKQKLFAGDFGWNTGKVEIEKNKVIFSETKPFPVVGFKMQVKPAIESPIPYVFTLFINGLDQNSQLDSVQVYTKGSRTDNSYFSLERNKLSILKNEADSIILFNRYFSRIDFSIIRLRKYQAYSVNLIPAERLFDLDKNIYAYRNSRLRAIKSKTLFKKIK